jgi:hypothetical protein
MSYPGEHQAIINQRIWDKVHAILTESPRKRAAHTRPKTPALLKGLLFGPDGAAFSPIHTPKCGNPPFHISDWGGERLREDGRWKFGTPPAGNANYAWLQHILHHLARSGTAGVVLANGSMSSTQSGGGIVISIVGWQ